MIFDVHQAEPWIAAPQDGEAHVRRWLIESVTADALALERLSAFTGYLRDENQRQNLIAASTAGESLWNRHIADSAQLWALANQQGYSAAGDREWVDLGSGPGLPGLVIAILAPSQPVLLVESRRRRSDFLAAVAAQLGLGKVTIAACPVDRVAPRTAAVISARAFAPLPRLVESAAHLAAADTLWLLPKGKNAVKELSSLSPAWQKLFHVKRSATQADAAILVGRGHAARLAR